MATQTIKTTFKLRRGEAQEWENKNPTLAEGEPAFEVDTGKLKIGTSDNQPFHDAKYIQVDYEDIVNKRGIIPAYEFVYKDDGTVAKAGEESLVMYVGWNAGGNNHYNKNKPRATSSNCLALGPYCEATYLDSAAFNYMGLAHAARSFACGRGTEVLGAHGAAFNRQTKAGGVNSAAFGLNTAAYGYCSAAFGQQTYVGIKLTTITQNGITYYSIPTNAAGTANVITPLFTTVASYRGDSDTTAQPIDADGNDIGGVINLTDPTQQTLRSMAFGHLTVANGENAIAAGKHTFAIGANAVAMGYKAQAQGRDSFAFGSYNSSATDETTVAGGIGSFAFGYGVVASDKSAVAMGGLTKASNMYSLATGYSTEASGAYSAAFNNTAKAKGSSSFAANAAVTQSSLSAAFNKGTTGASKECNFAINKGHANGSYSFAGGGGAQTTDAFDGAKATGVSSFAFGYGTTEAIGTLSVAWGQNCLAKKNYAFAGGLVTTSDGLGAFAYGSNLTVGSDYCVAFGYYNQSTWTDIDGTVKHYLLSIGNTKKQKMNALAVGDDFIEINNVRLTSTDLETLLALIKSE